MTKEPEAKNPVRWEIEFDSIDPKNGLFEYTYIEADFFEIEKSTGMACFYTFNGDFDPIVVGVFKNWRNISKLGITFTDDP